MQIDDYRNFILRIMMITDCSKEKAIYISLMISPTCWNYFKLDLLDGEHINNVILRYINTYSSTVYRLQLAISNLFCALFAFPTLEQDLREAIDAEGY